MARQVGTVLGVAGLVAILTHVTPGRPAGRASGTGCVLIIAFFAAAALTAAGLLTSRTTPR